MITIRKIPSGKRMMIVRTSKFSERIYVSAWDFFKYKGMCADGYLISYWDTDYARERYPWWRRILIQRFLITPEFTKKKAAAMFAVREKDE